MQPVPRTYLHDKSGMCFEKGFDVIMPRCAQGIVTARDLPQLLYLTVPAIDCHGQTLEV